MQSHPTLSALVEAVADGRDPDFSSVDLSSLDGHLRVRIESLRALFQIGQCFSTLTGSTLHASGHGADAVSSVMSRPLPATWGALQLRERVGRGRFGDVYRAWDPATERDVALKLLRHRSRATDSVVVHEARLMARVRHPNVVTIYGAAHESGQTGLWMEFIEGQTLETELRRSGPLSADEVGRIGVELCRALSAVHDAGLVHRDVKAQNVMRERTGRIVLGDFGTGLEVDPDAVDTTLAGTPVYLAPEIFEGYPASSRSDLYSLGVLLFHLATGSFPVLGGSVNELRQAHRARSSIATDIDPPVPSPLKAVIARALSAEPAERFETAVHMQSAVEQALAVALDARSEAVPAGVGQDRHVWVIAAAVVAVVVIAVGAFRSTTGSAWSFASFMPFLAGTEGTRFASLPTRQLRRVPAPTEAMFWGAPSSDGRTHTFIDMAGKVAVFDTASGEVRPLLSNEERGLATENATFSPDGLEVAFGWETEDTRRQVRVVNAQGGNARVVWEGRHWPVVVDWSSQDDTLLCVLQHDDGSRRLVTMQIPSGAVTEIATLDVGFSLGSFSPDGRHVVFDKLQSSDGVARDLFVVRTDAPGVRALISSASDDFGPLWLPDGSGVLFVSDRTAEPSIWSVAVDADGTGVAEPTLLHRNVGRVRPNGIAGGSLFYTLQVGLVDVFRATLDASREPAVADIAPIAPAHVGSKMNSDWSPEGDAIVYVALPHAGTGSDRSRRLAILDTRTSQVRTLNPPLTYYSFPKWSPDGRWILVKGTDPKARTGVFLVDARSGETHPIALVGGSTPQSIGPVRWGRDAWTVFFTRRALGLMALDLRTRIETRILNPREEGVVEFTNNPGFAFSSDGKSLAYSATRRTATGANETVLRVRDDVGRTHDLLTGPVVLQAWTADDRILFTRSDRASQLATLWSIAPTGGEPRAVTGAHVGLRDVQVRRDGRQITFTAGFPGSELWSLGNFLPLSREH
jgi:Tol biopolymer transport system component